MKKHFDSGHENDAIQQLIGLGKFSKAKSYYPDLRKKLDELQLEKEKYQSIFLNAQEGIFRAQLDGLVTDMNPAMTEILCGDSSNQSKASGLYFQSFLYDKFLWAQIITSLEHEDSISGLQTRLRQHQSEDKWRSESYRRHC